MRILGLVWALAIAACFTEPNQASLWGSDQASLSVTAQGATLQILASGDCYGSYGEITQPIGFGSFTLPGRYTQLMGVAPGYVRYPAEFSGSIVRGLMTLSVSIPTLQQNLGPFHLTLGEGRTWPPCLYP